MVPLHTPLKCFSCGLMIKLWALSLRLIKKLGVFFSVYNSFCSLIVCVFFFSNLIYWFYTINKWKIIKLRKIDSYLDFFTYDERKSQGERVGEFDISMSKPNINAHPVTAWFPRIDFSLCIPHSKPSPPLPPTTLNIARRYWGNKKKREREDKNCNRPSRFLR